MPETVFYIRGEFPLGAEREMPTAMLRDAKLLLDLSLDQLSSIIARLDSFSGFLDKSAIQNAIQPEIRNEETAVRLACFISALDEQFRWTGRNVDAFLKQIEDTLQKQAESERVISDEEFAELRRRLPQIVKPYPGLKRQAKAQRLANVTGCLLESVEVICDVRPVFNEDRTQVEGMIPFTILRVVSKGADGLPVAVEAILSQEQVKELAKKAAAAESKLSQLRRTLHSAGFTVPLTPLTKEG